MRWNQLAERVLDGSQVSHEDAMSVLRSHDDDLLEVMGAAFRLRRRWFGRSVNVHVLQNAKSGVCPEDCGFCSQALTAKSGVDRYAIQSVDELVSAARSAHAVGAATYCMVTATRGPSSRELDVVCEAVEQIKAELPIRVCTSLGMLRPEQATRLAEAGADRFNHNLETSRRYFPEVVSTHDYDDRIATVRAAVSAGMEACCGGILGMGETDEDRVDMAMELRDLRVESIPLNFLDPRPGTPMAENRRLRPQEALRALAMFRLVSPTADIRIAGGREVTLGSLQPLALYAATSLFVDGYLTTGGQGRDRDLRMIREGGFEVAQVSAT